MRILTTLGVAAIALGVLGCEAADDTRQVLDQAKSIAQAVANSDLTPDSVREYAQLAVAIEKEPQRAEQLLKDKGISAKDFEKALYSIASNAELSKLFEQAKKAVGN